MCNLNSNMNYLVILLMNILSLPVASPPLMLGVVVQECPVVIMYRTPRQRTWTTPGTHVPSVISSIPGKKTELKRIFEKKTLTERTQLANYAFLSSPVSTSPTSTSAVASGCIWSVGISSTDASIVGNSLSITEGGMVFLSSAA